MEVAERTKVSEKTTDELVQLYVQIRDKAAAESKEFKERKASLDAKMEKISGIILQRYRELGIESARTAHGTAFKYKEYRANIADKAVFRELLRAGEWELATLIPNKEGIKQYMSVHGDLPAGVNWSEEVVIRVNRA